jgi:hypothetical protein
MPSFTFQHHGRLSGVPSGTPWGVAFDPVVVVAEAPVTTGYRPTSLRDECGRGTRLDSKVERQNDSSTDVFSHCPEGTADGSRWWRPVIRPGTTGSACALVNRPGGTAEVVAIPLSLMREGPVTDDC